MNKIPKNSKIVDARNTKNNEILLTLKSKCRHYSTVTLKMIESNDGESELFITNVDNRCGLRECYNKAIRR